MTDQNTQFMAILTAVGEAKQANANALGIPWIITQMGVGDANGTEPTPNRLQTSLINERRRAPLNQLKVDPDNEAIIIAEQVIPENVGGWWIREIGLYDEAGDLVAVANCPPTFKPELSQGSGRTQLVRLHLLVSSTQNIVLKVDPSVVLATRAYVDSLTVRASQEDAELGEDNSKIATMLRVFQAMRSGAANATELIRGTLRLATAEQAQALTAGNVAITPATLGAALSVVAQNIAVFDTAGVHEWNVPDVLRQGLRKAHVTVVGGGGGGAGNATATGGSGGGAGACGIGLVDLSGQDTISVVVGTGGNGSSAGLRGGSGGTSSFGTYISAPGGRGGDGEGLIGDPSGLSMPAVGGDVNLPGSSSEPGTQVVATPTVLVGSSGAPSVFGGGGAG